MNNKKSGYLVPVIFVFLCAGYFLATCELFRASDRLKPGDFRDSPISNSGLAFENLNSDNVQLEKYTLEALLQQSAAGAPPVITSLSLAPYTAQVISDSLANKYLKFLSLNSIDAYHPDGHMPLERIFMVKDEKMSDSNLAVYKPYGPGANKASDMERGLWNVAVNVECKNTAAGWKVFDATVQPKKGIKTATQVNGGSFNFSAIGKLGITFTSEERNSIAKGNYGYPMRDDSLQGVPCQPGGQGKVTAPPSKIDMVTLSLTQKEYTGCPDGSKPQYDLVDGPMQHTAKAYCGSKLAEKPINMAEYELCLSQNCHYNKLIVGSKIPGGFRDTGVPRTKPAANAVITERPRLLADETDLKNAAALGAVRYATTLERADWNLEMIVTCVSRNGKWVVDTATLQSKLPAVTNINTSGVSVSGSYFVSLALSQSASNSEQQYVHGYRRNFNKLAGVECRYQGR